MWCNNYISVPFADKGRTRLGCDCWGLARIIYREQLNIDLPELLEYGNTKDSKSIAELYDVEHKVWSEVPLGEEKPFDILVFNIYGLPCHVAVVVDNGLMIHCEKGCGTHLSEYNKEAQWSQRLAGIYRYAK